MKELVDKLFLKHSFLIIFAFSLFATILALLSIKYNNEPAYIIEFNRPIYKSTNETFMKNNVYQLSLFVLNILCILFFIVTYLISMEKHKKRNVFILIILFFGFIINILCTFDLFFLKTNISVIFFIIPCVLIFLLLIPFSFIVDLLLKIIPNMPNIPEYISMGIMLFFIIFINNIIIKTIFKHLTFKYNNKNMILILYFVQNNTQLINLLMFLSFITIIGSQ
jgi:hypothetical protein